MLPPGASASTVAFITGGLGSRCQRQGSDLSAARPSPRFLFSGDNDNDLFNHKIAVRIIFSVNKSDVLILAGGSWAAS